MTEYVSGYEELVKEIVQKVHDSGEAFRLYLSPKDLEAVLLALVLYNKDGENNKEFTNRTDSLMIGIIDSVLG